MFDRNFSEALSIEQPHNSAQPPDSAQIAGYQILHYWGRRLYIYHREKRRYWFQNRIQGSIWNGLWSDKDEAEFASTRLGVT